MNKRKKRSWQKYLVSLFFLILGGVCGFLDAHYLSTLWEEKLSLGSFLFTIAFFLAEKDTEKADALWLQFQRCIRSYPYPADIESEQELIDIAKEKFKKFTEE